jgi:hypothetical protein
MDFFSKRSVLASVPMRQACLEPAAEGKEE